MSDDGEPQQQQQQQEEEEAPEASALLPAEDDAPRVVSEEEEEEEEAATSSAPAQPTQQSAPSETKDAAASITNPYRPWSRFLHPYYWGNALLFSALYASFRAQWLARAAAFADAAASSSATPTTTTPTTIPYSRALTKPADLLGWERQVLFTFAVIALYKTFLKRRSWDAALSHYLFYGRVLVAVVLFSCDWRWLVLHALTCWFSYAALAQPILDLDAIASARMKQDQEDREHKRKKRAAVAAAAAAGASAAPLSSSSAAKAQPSTPPPHRLTSGISIPMNPPRLRELVLVEESAAEAEAAAAAAALASGGIGSAKKTAKLLRVHQQQKDPQHQHQYLTNVGSADYWVLLIGCLSGGHHADTAAYAPAHAALAARYVESNNDDDDPPPRLRFAHLDASLFGPFCSTSPVLAMPPAQQLAWSRAVPCVLLIDGRSGKELARLPTRKQAEDPFRRNMFTAWDVERAFDLAGIARGQAPTLAGLAADKEDGGGEDGGGGGGGGAGRKAGAGGGNGAGSSKAKKSKDV
jgi:hypothetical protein